MNDVPFNPKIFHAYDIRGLYPEELNETAAHLIGQAFVRFTGAQTVVVGRDARTSSPSLYEALRDGLLSQGATVVNVGLVSTPMLYHAVGSCRRPATAGIMITASHNPKQYNGLKMVTGDVQPISAVTGLYDLRDLALRGPYPAVRRRGVSVSLPVRGYLGRVWQAGRFTTPGFAAWRPLKVVVDGGNGMAAASTPATLSFLPNVRAEYLYMEPDGTFPNHEANPLKPETLVDLAARVRATGADLGVAFDGDADRVGFVDEHGGIIEGDLMHAFLIQRLFAKSRLTRGRKKVVQYAVNESLIVPEEIVRAGGTPLMTPVGHGLAKPLMRQADALFGGEIAMHYYFRGFYGSECTDLVMLMVLEAVAESGQPLSELIAPLRRYWQSGEINSQVADVPAVMAAVRAAYGDRATKAETMDGLRLEFLGHANPAEDWWLSLRASNTEPLLRLVVEAKSRPVMEAVRDDLLRLIRG